MLGLPTVKICCGPRCGAEPGHRAIYAAVEKAAQTENITAVPTMCRGECGSGVSVVLPEGQITKIQDVATAKVLFLTLPQ